MANYFGVYNTFQLVLFLYTISICHCNDLWRDFNKPVDTSNWINPHDMGLQTKDNSDQVGTTSSPDVSTLKTNLQENCVLQSKKEDEDIRSKDDSLKKLEISDLESSLANGMLKKPSIPIERTFYLRFVMNLLKKISNYDFSEITHDSQVFIFTTEIQLMHWQIQALEKLANSSEKDLIGLLHQADTILNEMFYGFKPKESKSWRVTFSEFFQLPPETLITAAKLFGALSVTLVLLQFWTRRSFLSFFLAIFVISVIWKWCHMVKELEVEKYRILVNKRQGEDDPCQGKTSWLLGSSDKDCMEYHRAAHIVAFLEVNPLDAVAEAVTLVLVRPLAPLGENLGKFFQKFSSELSWFSYVPIMTILTVMILVGGILLMLMLFGYELHLPLFMGFIRPSPRSAPNIVTERREQLVASHRQPRLKTMGYLKRSRVHRRRETKHLSLT